MISLNGDRLPADLRQLASFGAFKTGVNRVALSPTDLEARRWLMQRMRDAGLEPQMDEVANVYGRNPHVKQALLIGSHTDTQPKGGWLDGAMGVIYGLEIARAFAADPACPGLGIDVAWWIDEEGNFPVGFLGSRAFVGELDPSTVADARSRDGVVLGDALKAAGLAGVPLAKNEPGRYKGFLEAHVEQGGTLERDKKRIGVVTAIVGIRGGVATFK